MSQKSKPENQKTGAPIQVKCNIKVLVVGLSGTGKTSFVHKWVKNKFETTYKATIVSEYGGKVVNKNGSNFLIQLWDLAGQDKNISTTKIMAKDALGVIVCADCTNKKTFEDAMKWKKTINDLVVFPDQNPLPNILLENKVDLLSEQEREDTTALDDFVRANNFDGGLKTSAKDGYNVDKAMDFFIDLILSRLEETAKTHEAKDVYKAEKFVVALDPQHNQKPRDQMKMKNDNCC